jgi:hypothetical protein
LIKPPQANGCGDCPHWLYLETFAPGGSIVNSEDAVNGFRVAVFAQRLGRARQRSGLTSESAIGGQALEP